MKVMKLNLPNLNEKPGEFTEEKFRTKLKDQGLLPPRTWMERQFYISCTGVVFEPFVPPEGDGKLSIVSKGGAIQTFRLLEKKSKSMLSVRKIRSFDEDFDLTKFAQTAQDIYISAHNNMVNRDRHKFREVITEKLYPELIYNTFDKTIHWKFIKSLEPPRVVHSRCTHVISKENVYGQVTVRFHTQQQLAVYDRFGRLMHGSEILAKDVLEYVVFEKHLANMYGIWRMHGKIIPDWMPPKQPSAHTFIKAEKSIDVPSSTEPTEKLRNMKVEDALEAGVPTDGGNKPQLATA